MPREDEHRPPIGANEEQLSNLFSERFYFEIPRFQRSYAWEIDEYSVFWDDIVRAYRAPNGHVHFLGPMVFARNPGRPSLGILDGQQRLSTLMLLLASMKAAAETLPDSEDAENLREDLAGALKVRVTSGGRAQRLIRLQANRQDRQVFESLVTAGSARCTHDSHKLMKKSYDYLAQQVSKLMADGDPTVNLSALWESILSKFWYIHIICESEINAQVVFESLNAKGEDLSSADLIKNYLFMEVDRTGTERDLDEADNTWALMVNNLGRDSELSDFMRTFWNSRYSFVRADELYGTLREAVNSRAGNVWDYLRSLEREARVFAGFRTPTAEFWQSASTARMMREFKVLNIRVTRSVLMALWSRLCDTPQEYEDAVRGLLNFMIRYSKITERPSNTVEEAFSQWAVDIRAGVREPAAFQAWLAQEAPSRDQFIESFRTLKVKSGPTARLLLSKINNAMQAGGEPEEMITNSETATLEHVIPQTPNEHWKELLEQQGATLDDIVNRLGNLTLLVQSWNTAASNRSFSEKRDSAYAQSSLPLNQDLIRSHVVDSVGQLLPLDDRPVLDEFTLVDLNERQARLGHVAEAIWTV